MLRHFQSDLRFALRMLRKNPLFAVVTVLAISLGSGAATTVYSAMNALVLRPLPAATDGSRLMGLELTRRDGQMEQAGTSGAYEHLRDRARTLSGLAAWSRASLSIATSGRGAVVVGNMVSGNYFSVLGLQPALGRFFVPDEDRTPNAHPVVVVSHAFWTAELGGDSSMVGRRVSVNGNPYTLIGIAPQGFRGVISLMAVDGWIPLMMQSQINPDRNLATARWLRMFGRLRAGADVNSAQAELAAMTAAFSASQTATQSAAAAARQPTGVHLAMLRGMPEDARKPYFSFMRLLLGAAFLVLLIASVNVASLLSARAVARRRELALRAALGAGRGRLFAQLLTEILLLFCLGAAGGLAIAFAATRAATVFPLPPEISAPDLSPDLRVMFVALCVSLITGLLFGLAPSLRAARDDIAERLRANSAGAGMRRSVAGNALIVGQLALSLVLLVGAGLFLRALNAGARVHPGFDRTGVTVASFDTQVLGYDADKARLFYRELSDRLAMLPGVSAVGYASFAPLTNRAMNTSIVVNGDSLSVSHVNVGDSYFEALRMSLRSGRVFVRGDNESAPRVAVVNEVLAKQLAPAGDALGMTFLRGRQPVTVVGIVRNARYENLSEAMPPVAYFSLEQFWQPHQTLLVRSSTSHAQPVPVVLRTIRSIDSALPAPPMTTLAHATDITLVTQRIAATISGVLGGVGFLLATLGLYGTIAYSVNRRAREIGIRVALGAQRKHALGLVLGEGMRLAVGGILIGVVAAAATTRLIAGLLFDVSALDGATFGVVSTVFLLVAGIATYVPARRAANADPMITLRAE